MTEQNQGQDQPLAGRVVGGASAAVEQVANQVESAAVSATEFASDNVLARAIGYIRAAKEIIAAGAQGTLNVTNEGGDILLREVDEFRESAEQSIKRAGEGGSGNR